MRKLMRHWTVIVLVLIMVLAAAGCGKESKKDSADNAGREDTPVVIITAEPKDPQADPGEGQNPGSAENGGKSDASGQELPGGDAPVQPETAPPAPGETASPGVLPQEDPTENGGGNSGNAGSSGNAGDSGNSGNSGGGNTGESEKAPEPIIVATGSGWLYGQDEKTYEMLYRLSYPYIDLWGEDVQEYKELENALLEINEEFRMSAVENEKWFKETAEMIRSNDPDNTLEIFSEEELFVVRSDSRILSIGSSYSSYGGGAHGMYGFHSYNFDPKTGKMLTLRDITTDPAALLGKIKEAIKKDYPDLYIFNEESSFSEEAMDSYVFTVGYDTITVYFEPYVLASYADGAQVVDIPFKGNESLIRSEYLSEPASYGAWLVGNGGYKDLNGDSDPEHIWVELKMDADYDAIEKYTVHVGSQTYTEENVYAFQMDPFLLHAYGKYFLYVELTVENDYRFTTIYDITGGTIRKVTDSMFCGAKSWFMDEETGREINYRIHLTDPGLLLLTSRTDVLGTGIVYSYFYVGEDGIPVNYNEGYWIEHYADDFLTLKQDLTVIAIEPNAEHAQGEEVVLPKGVKLRPYYTDNESYVELCDENENCYWVRGQFVNWPLTVNNIAVDDVFDGVMYAG